MNREAIYGALFTLMQTAPGLVTTSRTLKHWGDVPANQMPALFMAQGAQTAQTITNQLTRWHLDAKVYVYVSTDGATSPGAVMNPIIDAIATALGNFPTVQTLGGLVQWARIEGTIETSEGTLGDTEVSIIPIRILAF
jgi:hypothetical protein